MEIIKLTLVKGVSYVFYKKIRLCNHKIKMKSIRNLSHNVRTSPAMEDHLEHFNTNLSRNDFTVLN